jgi:hypothetical protein
VLAQPPTARRGPAIEPARPTGLYKTVDEALQAFAGRADDGVRRTTQDDLRRISL